MTTSINDQDLVSTVQLLFDQAKKMSIAGGECQGSCRVIQAAAGMSALGGFRTTRPIGVQLRVAPLQRSGFEARARW